MSTKPGRTRPAHCGGAHRCPVDQLWTLRRRGLRPSPAASPTAP